MSMRRLVPFVFAALAACRGYQPGTLQVQQHGELRTVGCLDIAVAPLDDAAADGPVASISFANRCDAAVQIDLAALRATGVFAARGAVPLQMFDPAGVVRAGMLEARMVGREDIEWSLPSGATEQPAQLCLDLAGLDPAAALDRPVIACVELSRARVAAR
jgi:hypothetical protein